jgi:hypothetical protein
LGSIGPPAGAAVQELIAALPDRASDFKSVVIETIGKIGPAAQAAVGPLLRVLRNPDALPSGDVSPPALPAFGQQGQVWNHGRLSPDGSNRISFREPEVIGRMRGLAAKSLMMIGGADALRAVLRDADPEMMRVVIKALRGGRINEP